MKSRLEAELSRRESLLSDKGHERPSDVRTSFCGDEIVATVRELIRLENASLHHREVFAAAEEAMKSGPATMTNSVVVHFGKLFDVKRLEGMFPKMNVGVAGGAEYRVLPFTACCGSSVLLPCRHSLLPIMCPLWLAFFWCAGAVPVLQRDAQLPQVGCTLCSQRALSTRATCHLGVRRVCVSFVCMCASTQSPR